MRRVWELEMAKMMLVGPRWRTVMLALPLCAAPRSPCAPACAGEGHWDSPLTVATKAGRGVLPLYVSRDWTNPLPGVTRALIVIHGFRRNAGTYFAIARHTVRAARRRRVPAPW